MSGARIAIGLVCMVFLAGCASAQAFRVVRSDAIGPCQTSVPEGTLLGVALSGGGAAPCSSARRGWRRWRVSA
jgi:hypothetical protein